MKMKVTKLVMVGLAFGVGHESLASSSFPARLDAQCLAAGLGAPKLSCSACHISLADPNSPRNPPAYDTWLAGTQARLQLCLAATPTTTTTRTPPTTTTTRAPATTTTQAPVTTTTRAPATTTTQSPTTTSTTPTTTTTTIQPPTSTPPPTAAPTPKPKKTGVKKRKRKKPIPAATAPAVVPSLPFDGELPAFGAGGPPVEEEIEEALFVEATEDTSTTNAAGTPSGGTSPVKTTVTPGSGKKATAIPGSSKPKKPKKVKSIDPSPSATINPLGKKDL